MLHTLPCVHCCMSWFIFFYYISMDDLPSELQNIIVRWVCEFNRVDAIERMATFRIAYGDIMRHVVNDIRNNVPLYVFHILTCSKHVISISLILPHCDPYSVDLRHRIPESHICSYVRCSLTLRKHAYENFRNTMYCARPRTSLLLNEIIL